MLSCMLFACRVILVGSTIWLLSSCGPQEKLATDTAARVAQSSVASDSLVTPPAGPTVDSARIPVEMCTRGAAEPIVKKAVFPRSTFRLLPDKVSGEETVDLPRGDKLTIQNRGCEYYVLTFRFETSRFRAAPADARYWHRSASVLLRQAAPGLDTPFDLKKAASALQKAAVGKALFGDELRLNPEKELMGETLVLDTVQQLAANRYAVAITLYVGPL